MHTASSKNKVASKDGRPLSENAKDKNSSMQSDEQNSVLNYSASQTLTVQQS